MAIGARQEPGDFLHRDAAGKFSRHRAAHAIADREDKIRMASFRFAHFTQMMNLASIKLLAQKGVFVVRPNASAIGLARPAEARRWMIFDGKIHD